jgi:hypothetical protein
MNTSPADTLTDHLSRHPHHMNTTATHTPAGTRMRRVLTALLLALALRAGYDTACAADANPPDRMTYQGYLADANGNPLAPSNPINYDVLFRIYDAQTGGALLWAEKQTVTVDKGLFSVLLGEGAANASDPRPALNTVFAAGTASDRYLDLTVTIGGSPLNIAPRLRLISSPYSFLARTATALVSPNGSNLVTTANGVLTINGSLNATNGFTGSGASLTALNASQLTSGTVPDARLSGTYSGVLTLNNAANVFSGSGASLTALNGANITSGTIANARTTATDANTANAIVARDASGKFTANTIAVAQTDNTTSYLPGFVHTRSGVELRTGIGTNGVGYIGTFSGHPLSLMTGDNTKMFITASGDVGINTTSPGAKLEVNASAATSKALIVKGAASQTANLQEWQNSTGSPVASVSSNGNFSLSGTNLVFNATDGVINWGPDGALHFRTLTTQGNPTSYSEKMTILANGKVGIGTTSPTYPLQVHTGDGHGIVHSAGTVKGGTWIAASSSQRMLLGTISDHPLVMMRNDSSKATLENNGSWTAVSDARIKRIVGRPEPANALADICKLQVADYQLLDDPDETIAASRGFIAQEVEKVMPEAVTRTRDFIPCLLASATKTQFREDSKKLTLALSSPHGLKIGDVVRLKTLTGTMDLPVVGVASELEFELGECKSEPKQVLVWGKQVPDFRSVNYDRLFTTGLGAIQELARRNDELEKKVEALRKSEARIAELEQRSSKMEAELAELKKLVARVAAHAQDGRPAAEAPSITVRAGDVR